MSSNNSIIDNNLLSNTLRNSHEIDNLAVNLSYSQSKQINTPQHNNCSHSSNQEILEKRDRSNSNTVCQLDEMFIGLVKKLKKEKPTISAQKSSISRHYNTLYKSRIQSTIELNNVNPLTTNQQISLKQTNPINTGNKL
jgi:hypothetical protein